MKYIFILCFMIIVVICFAQSNPGKETKDSPKNRSKSGVVTAKKANRGRTHQRKRHPKNSHLQKPARTGFIVRKGEKTKSHKPGPYKRRPNNSHTNTRVKKGYSSGRRRGRKQHVPVAPQMLSDAPANSMNTSEKQKPTAIVDTKPKKVIPLEKKKHAWPSKRRRPPMIKRPDLRKSSSRNRPKMGTRKAMQSDAPQKEKCDIEYDEDFLYFTNSCKENEKICRISQNQCVDLQAFKHRINNIPLNQLIWMIDLSAAWKAFNTLWKQVTEVHMQETIEEHMKTISFYSKQPSIIALPMKDKLELAYSFLMGVTDCLLFVENRFLRLDVFSDIITRCPVVNVKE